MNARHACVLLLGWSCLAFAHHSVGTSYDKSTELKYEMVVERFHFINPHPYITARAVGNSDALWTLEMDNRQELVQLGFTESTLVPGDRIRVTVNPSRYNRYSVYVESFEHPRLGFKYVTNIRQLLSL